VKTIESLKQSILNKIALIKGFAINILNKLAEENAGFIGHTVAKIAEDILSLFGEIDTLTGNPNVAQYKVRKYTMDTNGNYGNPVEEIHSWIWDEEISVDTAELSTGFSYNKTYPGYYATGTINEDGSTVFDVYIKRNTYSLSLVVTDSLHPGYIIVDGETYEYTYVISLLYGQNVSIERYIPLCDGYTFNTWDQAVPSTMPASNVLLRATWTTNTYTVSWNVDGVITTQTYEYMATIVPPQNPWKEGYTFTGWTPSVAQTMPYQNLSYVAVFTPNLYTLNIIYQAWDVLEFDGVIPYGYAGQVEYDSFFSIPSPTGIGNVNGSDYNVSGYYPDQSIIEGVMPAVEGYTFIVTYFPETYTTTWDVDGNLTTEQVVYHHWPVGIPDPTKEGYVFDGWYPYVNIQPAYDITYTAQWYEKTYPYTITVYTMNVLGNYTTPATYTFYGGAGTEINAESVAIDRGWITDLDGEFFDREHSGYDAIGTVDPEQTTELTIYIGRNTFILTYQQRYEDDSGHDTPYTQIMYTDTVYFGSPVTMPPAPNVNGYYFISWDNTDIHSVPTYNVTFTALYKKTYSLKLFLDSGTATYDWEDASYDSSSDILTIRGQGGVEIPTITMTLEGYTFGGWNVDLPETFSYSSYSVSYSYRARWIPLVPITATYYATYGYLSPDEGDPDEDDPRIIYLQIKKEFTGQTGDTVFADSVKIPNGELCVTLDTDVRSGAGTTYNIVDSLPAGSVVYPLERSDNWIRIGTNRWIDSFWTDDNYYSLFTTGGWLNPNLDFWSASQSSFIQDEIDAYQSLFPGWRVYCQYAFDTDSAIAYGPGDVEYFTSGIITTGSLGQTNIMIPLRRYREKNGEIIQF